MTHTLHPETLELMQSVSVQSNSHTKINYLCMYDSEYSEKYSHPHVYYKGICSVIKSRVQQILYEDGYLHDKDCVWLGYIHYPVFKNQFLAKKFTHGHEHLKCFVSSNDISILDSIRKDDENNIIFTGELCEGMPFRHKKLGLFSLYVIEAELNPEKFSTI